MLPNRTGTLNSAKKTTGCLDVSQGLVSVMPADVVSASVCRMLLACHGKEYTARLPRHATKSKLPVQTVLACLEF